jgi:hypothetical protein
MNPETKVATQPLRHLSGMIKLILIYYILFFIKNGHTKI